MADHTRTIADLVYAGFNSQVVALDRYTGEVVWKWTAPKGSGFVSLLIDSDRLIVSVNGYMYCLDPLFGQLVWQNPLKGFGVGVTSLASVNGVGSISTGVALAAAAAQAAAQRQSASAG